MLFRLVGFFGLALLCTAGDTTLAIRATAQRVKLLVCDTGFDYDPDQKSCIKEEEYFPNEICTTGAHHNHQCTSVTPASTVCPDGFSVEGTECVQRTTFPPSEKCLPGQVQGESYCLERNSAPVKSICEFPAYELDGQCVRDAPRCKKGWRLAGDDCVTSNVVCPRGNVDGEECYLDSTCPGGQCYVCDREKLLMRLETRSASDSKTRLRSSKMGSLDVCGTQPCLVRRQFISSDESAFLRPRTCMMHLETAPEVVTEPVERTAHCTGQGTTNDCYELRRHVFTPSCPPNAQLRCSDGRCQCTAVRKKPGVLGCKAGSTLRGKVCVTSSTPALVCAETDTLLKGVCVKVIQKPVIVQTSVTVNCVGKRCVAGTVASNISAENSMDHAELATDPTSTPLVDHTELATDPTFTPLVDHAELATDPTSTPLVDHAELATDPTSTPLVDHAELATDPTSTPLVDHAELAMDPTSTPLVDHAELATDPTSTPLVDHAELATDPTSTPLMER
ncbi:MAG: hypothetical protein KVP17_003652 [Porospora cf. gigantea B]|uniref:uncharacterized protein n=1 Tax=Porospora cf. gigantea B TaxID=2853592 RepID=UPI003571D27F|nr:MAG: hypothetical protein KVP17_003652 [Porospora cf. gigantea B]